MLKQRMRPEKQRRHGSTFTVIAAEQSSSVTVFRWLQWAKRPRNNGLSTMALRWSRRYTDQGQRLTGGRWPRRGACDGEVAGREEEEFAPRFSGEIRRPKLAGWMRKEYATNWSLNDTDGDRFTHKTSMPCCCTTIIDEYRPDLPRGSR